MELKTIIRLFIINTITTFGFVFNQNTCSFGVITLGYTIPNGDITKEYGKPLDIICVLYDDVAKELGPNASTKLFYKRNNQILSDDLIEIINETSIRLHIDKPDKAISDSYTCMLNSTELKSVCYNYVFIGNKPLPVQDFKCIGYNYENLTCSWTPPENYVKTEYTLNFSLKGRGSRFANNKCPNLTKPTVNDKKMYCVWNLSTTPQYRQAHEEFTFTLRMENALGTNQIEETFKHFQHVLSGPPENLTQISVTPSSIYLYWMVPNQMRTFPRGLHHRILYQCSHGEKKWHFGGLITNQTHQNELRYNLTGLKYAHTLCNIRVSIRSSDALVDDESMWSKNASITVRTDSKVPDAPPRTDVGSFEIVTDGNNLQYCEAYIYWQQIPDEMKNGPNFKYHISVEGNDVIIPVETTDAYAKFQNLSIAKSYQFNIWSSNEKGRSINRSVVYVPKQFERISEPVSFSKVEFVEGVHELTWEPPKLGSNQVLTNYTVFWCNNDKDRPHQCTGQLNWTTVPSTKTQHNETVRKDKIYQFAISANTETSSSGMLWASCTVIYKKNMGKMKYVWIERVGSTYIDVRWKLECSSRMGSVMGFIVYYCPTVSPHEDICKSPQKNKTFYGDSSVTGGNITDLTPYTTYTLTVSVITKYSAFSQQSDPLHNTTLEAAPSSPPIDFKLDEITNSTIKLSWKPPPITNGVLKYYLIDWIINSTQMNPDQNEIILKNLTSFQNYTIYIRACTTLCSNAANLTVATKMGYPDKISQPTVLFQNNSVITITWLDPAVPRGKNDYYEIQFRQKHDQENTTVPIYNVTKNKYTIEDCGDENKYKTFFVSVRAVNLDVDKVFKGPWSDELQSYCRNPIDYLIYSVIGVVMFLIVCGACASRRLYNWCKVMQDVEVKLPPGLAPAITDHTLMPWRVEKPGEDIVNDLQADQVQLLEKLNGGRHRSADSSGCSSAHESVSSSLESATHMSQTSDSGTEQPPSPTPSPTPSTSGVSPTNALDPSPNSSLRLRNVTVLRPNSKNYTSLPSDTNGNGYCVLGVEPTTSAASAIDVLPPVASPTVEPPSGGGGGYVPWTAAMHHDNHDKSPYIMCDMATPSTPYVVTGEPLKSINPGYVPFNTIESSTDKDTGYVVAGIKGMLGSELLHCDNVKSITDDKPIYVKTTDTFLLTNLKQE